MEQTSLEGLELLCRQSVDVDQQVLEPLTKLRGVQNVKVEGRITDDWAGYVKICVEGNLGTTPGGRVYEHRTNVNLTMGGAAQTEKASEKIGEEMRSYRGFINNIVNLAY